MRRREFIAGLAGAAVWPLAASAQQPDRMRRIGILLPAAADNVQFQAWVGAFLQELALLTPIDVVDGGLPWRGVQFCTDFVGGTDRE
jgi:putative ABC transport system substrate-binding protein